MRPMENIFLFYYFFLLLHFNILKFFSNMPFYLSVHATSAGPTFPKIPKLSSNEHVSTYLEDLLLFIGKMFLYPIEYILYAIGDGLGTGITGLFTSLFAMASTTYNNSVSAFSFAGPLAPILVSIVWGISLVIIIFFIFMAVHLIWGDIQDDTGD